MERAILIWPDMKNYVKNVEKGTLGKITCKSFVTIAEACKDETIMIKLNFFLCLSKIIQPVLEKYQRDPLLRFFLLSTCLN